MRILVVIGIAVSNGILLFGDANRQFNGGIEKADAIVAAASPRSCQLP